MIKVISNLRTGALKLLSSTPQQSSSEERIEPLRKVLEDELETLSLRIIGDDRTVDEDDVAKVEKIARLVEIHKSLTRPNPRKFWPWLTGTVISLAAVGALLVFSIPRTEIELDLSVSGISFVIPEPSSLMQGLRLTELEILEGLQYVEIDNKIEAASNVRIVSEGKGASQGRIALIGLKLPADTQVTIQKTQDNNKFRIYLHSKALLSDKLDLLADVNMDGPVNIALTSFNALGQKSIKASSLQFVRLRFNSKVVALEVAIPKNVRSDLSEGTYKVRELCLNRTDLAQSSRSMQSKCDGGGDRIFSNILSGTLYFSELGRRKHDLRPTDEIVFEELGGDVWNHQLHSDRIGLRFAGSVSGIRLEPNSNEKDLMPSLLEWIAAQYPVAMITAIFGFALGLLKFLLSWRG